MSSAMAQIHGYVGSEPEVRYSDNGTAFASYSIATTHKVNGQDITDWHKIKAIGKIAEFCGKYLHKGSEVIVRGDIQTETFTTKDGKKITNVVIMANSHDFCGKKGENEQPNTSMSDGFINIADGLDADSLPFV